MKMVKSLLLGAAAGTVAVVGAQAADLPVKAKPVEYVKVCSLYGAGFYYVPGTDTCIKFGGYVRVQLDVGAGSGGQARGTGSQANEGRNTRNDTANTNFRNRIAFDVDARSQTAYGTLRSYARFGVQQTTPGNSVGGSAWWDRAFIQFAGFTIGHAVSFFDIYTFGGAQSLLNVRTAGTTGATGITIFAYTYQFGNGFSATLSMEDPSTRQAGIQNLDDPGFTAVYNPSGGVLTDSSAWSNRGAGQRFWDVVGQLRLDQSWGYIAASGALVDASGGLYTCANGVGGPVSEWTFCGNPGNKLGWAASVGGKVKMPFAPADSLGVNFVYAKGATGYATNIGRASMYSSDPGFANTGWGSAGFGFNSSGIYATGTNVELTTAWSINAGYEHVWNPSFRQVAHFGYVKIDYNSNATAMICSEVGPALSNCNPDWSFWQAGLFSKWTPVRGLDIGLDVFYTKINTAFAGNGFLPSNGSRPQGDYRIEDQDQWSMIFRVQRNFP